MKLKHLMLIVVVYAADLVIGEYIRIHLHKWMTK